MVEFLSGRVKKTPSSEVSEDRYSYLKLEEAEPDLGVPSSNNAILISDSTGNRDWLFVSDGLSISVSNTGIYSLSHDNTSDVANLVSSSRTYVTELSFDEFGHVLSYSTGTETVVDNDTFVVSASFNTSDGILTLTRNDANTVTVDLDGRYLSESGPGSGLDADTLDGQHGTYYLDWGNFTNTPDATITVSGTNGLTGTGSFAVDDFANTSISLSHDNTSDVTNLVSSSRTYVTGLTFDEFGHVVSYATDTETVTNTDTFVNSASFNTSDGILTLTRNDANTVTVDLDGRYLTSESDDLDSVTTRGSTTTNNITVGDLTADNVTFQGNLQIDGTLTVSGNVVTINASELSIDDNMIYLNANANFTNPDLGIAGGYNDGTYAHAGIFRDATDGRWKVFDGYTPEPDESIYINTAHESFSLADFQAETIYGDLVGNATTATTLETARTISLTGNASGSFDFDGSANVSFSVTVSDSDQLDGQHGTYYLDWTNFTNTPDATITVSGTNGLTGTGSFAVDDFANTTISLSHDNTSDVANLVAASRTYVTGLTFDEFGHVVSYTTDTETVVDTDTFVNALSFDANTGILTVTRNDAVSLNVDLDTRYLSASGPGSGLDADTLDGQHGTYYLDYNNFTNVPIIGDGTIIVNTGSGLTGSGTFSVNDESNTTFTLSHDNTSDVSNLATATGVYVNGITFDEFGHVVSYTTETAASASDTYVVSGSYDANTSILSLNRNDSNTVNISFGNLNADTLDSLDSTQFVRSDVSDTISGDITFSANVTFDTVTISSIQTSIDAFVDSDNSLMTAAAIDDRIAAAGGLTQEQEDILEILQDDSSYFYTAIGDLYTKAEPSGSDTYVQYNNAGIFGSDSTFTFNDSTNTLSVPNIIISSQSTLTNLSVSGNADLGIVTANTITTDGNVTIGGTLNTYSIDAMYDTGILNSADSAYFFTKIEEIEENSPFSEIVFTSSNTSSQEIYSFDGNVYGTCKFIITAKNTVSNDRYALEMLVVHNDTTSYETIYAESGNTSLSTYSSSMSENTVSIDAIPGSSDIIKHRIIGQLIVGD